MGSRERFFLIFFITHLLLFCFGHLGHSSVFLCPYCICYTRKLKCCHQNHVCIQEKFLCKRQPTSHPDNIPESSHHSTLKCDFCTKCASFRISQMSPPGYTSFNHFETTDKQTFSLAPGNTMCVCVCVYRGKSTNN